MEEQKEKVSALSWPATTEEMRQFGYREAPPHKQRKLCTCKVVFHYWISANGRWQPFTSLDEGLWMPHHATCQNVKDFRVANGKHKARTEKPQPVQEALF